MSSLDVVPLRTHTHTPGTGVFGGLLLAGLVRGSRSSYACVRVCVCAHVRVCVCVCVCVRVRVRVYGLL